MIYKIICNGKDDFKELYKKDNNEVIIACDGGYNCLNHCNVRCDYFFGDLDSIKEGTIIEGVKHIFNPVKDQTDLEIALDFISKIVTDDDEIIIYNATGGRLDHYEGALRLLKEYINLNIKIVDRNNLIHIIKNFSTKEVEKRFNKSIYKYISFFNICDETIISLQGFKYNLDNYLMKKNEYLCISNEILQEDAVIIYNKHVLVIESI